MSSTHRHDAVEILRQCDPTMLAEKTARLLGNVLCRPIDGETTTALLELVDPA